MKILNNEIQWNWNNNFRWDSISIHLMISYILHCKQVRGLQ
jgi:hypothetical protein